VKVLTISKRLLIFVIGFSLFFLIGTSTQAFANTIDEKPFFESKATVTGNDVRISVISGVDTNIEYILLVNREGNLVGNMTSSGNEWSYNFYGLQAGEYSYNLVVSCKSSKSNESDKRYSSISTLELIHFRVTDILVINTTQYGTSGNGRPLNVVSIKPKDATSKIMVVFELHGFEDCYKNDGWALVNIGQEMINYFSAHPEDLNGKSLYVVSSANPDGLIDGWTNNGPGRCQTTLGVDINRDFSYLWRQNLVSRNKTLSAFSAPESVALRDLVIGIKPTYIFDIHGWLNCSYGSNDLVKHFEKPLGIYRKGGISEMPGYFVSWAWGTGYCQDAALIELPNPYISPQKVVDSIINVCNETSI